MDPVLTPKEREKDNKAQSRLRFCHSTENYSPMCTVSHVSWTLTINLAEDVCNHRKRESRALLKVISLPLGTCGFES